MNRSDHLALLDSTPTEMEAGVIVAALEQAGISATMTGMHTAGFRAEAPGWVKILVAEQDLPRAQDVLRQIVLDNMNIDWSQVDVGEPEDEPSAQLADKPYVLAPRRIFLNCGLYRLVCRRDYR